MSSLNVVITTVLALAMTGCSLLPQRSNVYSVPSFPPLALEDYPSDPRGFCLSGDEAAKLALYINQLEGLASDNNQ